MKNLSITVVLVALAFPSVAGAQHLTDFDPYDSADRYFGPAERIFAPVIMEFERYPRPSASLGRMDIPDGAGGPVPVDPVDLVGAYAPGQVAVPLGARTTIVAVDPKGSSVSDRRRDSRAAW